MKYFLYLLLFLFIAAVCVILIISYLNRGVGQSLVDSSARPSATALATPTPIPTPTPQPINKNTQLEETLNSLTLPDLKTDIDTLEQQANQF